MGDEIVALPAGTRARVAQILTADGELDAAGADMAVTLRLDSEIDVSRGDLFAAPEAAPAAAQDIDAEVCWFDAEPLAPGRVPRIC